MSYAWQISPADIIGLDDSIQATMLDILEELAKENRSGK